MSIITQSFTIFEIKTRQKLYLSLKITITKNGRDETLQKNRYFLPTPSAAGDFSRRTDTYLDDIHYKMQYEPKEVFFN